MFQVYIANQQPLVTCKNRPSLCPGPHPRWAGYGPEVPVEGLEREAAEVAAASGEASAEQGPLPGRLEPGMEANERALAGQCPRAAGPGLVAG